MAPPCQAVVLSIDEKSQIQALDRTQPGLPLKPRSDLIAEVREMRAWEKSAERKGATKKYKPLR